MHHLQSSSFFYVFSPSLALAVFQLVETGHERERKRKRESLRKRRRLT